MPRRAVLRSDDVDAHVPRPDGFVAPEGCLHELDLRGAVLGKGLLAEGLVGGVVARERAGDPLGQQNPCPELVQEVALDLRHLLLLPEVDEEAAVAALPADPALDIGRAAEESVRQRRLTQLHVSGRRSLDPHHPGTVRQIGPPRLVRHVALTVEPAVLLGRIAPLVDDRNSEMTAALLEKRKPGRRGGGVRHPFGAVDLQLGVLERQAREAHAVEQHRIVGHGRLGQVKEFVVAPAAVAIEHALLVGHRRIVDPELLAAGQQTPFEQLLVLVDMGRRRTVIAAHEGAHERVAVQIGIPHQLAHHVGPHLGEAAAPLAADLREVHRHVVAAEELDVLLQDREVGEGREHVVEIDAVVPDEEVVADGRPPLQRPHEVAARGVVRQGHLALAVDVAEHDVDVGPRLDMFGRVHRVEVGQRRKLLVGEAVGQSVQEVDEAARRPALALVERPARGAGAVGEVAVVLAHRDRVHPGVGPEDRVDLRADHLEELGIGR